MVLSTTIFACTFLFAIFSFSQDQSEYPIDRSDESEPDTEFRLKAWHLIAPSASLALSPLILSTTQSDMDYLESFAVAAAGSATLVGTLALTGILFYVPIFGKNSKLNVVPTVLGIGLLLSAPVLASFVMEAVDNNLGLQVSTTS